MWRYLLVPKWKLRRALLRVLRMSRKSVHAALSAAQDEIERRISECETHRVLIDACSAEREAETQRLAIIKAFLLGGLVFPLNKFLVDAARDYWSECARHRRAVVDSIGGA